ncbi:MAG TPA: potassium transporter TrkG [Alphaproteobacteria bacterium]
MAAATILALLGALLVGLAAAELAPLAVALALGEAADVRAFGLGAGTALFFGVVLLLVGRGTWRRVTRRDALVLAALGWAGLSLFAALPFALAGVAPNAPGAVLEAVSGLTTTGLSVIADPAGAGRSVVLWRALLQWIGGAATLVFAATLIPQVGFATRARRAGASSPERLAEPFRPRFFQAAQAVLVPYAVLTVLCFMALAATGLTSFHAACYALSTVSTGGFSPDRGGPLALGNGMAEMVLILFMAAGAINFTVHWAALCGRPRAYGADPETGFMLLVVATAAVLLAVLGVAEGAGAIGAELRRALFQAVSAATTTGYGAGADSGPDPVFVVLVLAGLVLVGGASTSTAGGIKLGRALLLLRQSVRELERLAHPHGVVVIKLGRTSITDSAMEAVWAYFVLFLACLITLALGLAAVGLDAERSMLLALSAIANTGPLLTGAAGLGGSLASLPETAHWLLALGMLVGRLELFAVLMLLTPEFWQR